MDSSKRELNSGLPTPLFHLLNIFLLLLTTAIGIKSWNKLPAMVPIHFRADGLPNRWTEKGSEFLILFIFPWLLTALMYTIILFIPWFKKHPQWINVPNKKKFLSLPPDRQAPIFDGIKRLFLRMSVVTNLILFGIIYSTVQVGLGRYQRLPWWSTWPGLALMFLVLITNTINLLKLINQQTRK
jgi:hypothetical protein